MKTRLTVFILGVLIAGSVIFAMLFESPFEKEHYDIEIVGLKDVYLVGEPYSFSYLISGYGYSCGDREITYPDENGNTMWNNVDVDCNTGVPKTNFVINSKNESNIEDIRIKNPGRYSIGITYERSPPTHIEPTQYGKGFHVVEKICDYPGAKERAQCFVESYESCESAYMTQQFTTGNGESISLTAVVESWYDCTLRVYTTNPRGDHSPFNGIRSICEDVIISNNSLSFESCSNADYPPIVFLPEEDSEYEKQEPTTTNEMKKHADSFSEINRQGTFYKDNENSEKFEEYRILMQKTQKEIASKILTIPISNAYVAEGWNFPFRDVFEVTPMGGTEPVLTCGIPEKIPAHLQKIRQSDMFQIFAEKYSQHQLTIDISDERYSRGLVHYDLIATSDDKLFSASTYFHLDSCTDEMKWPYFLLCKDLRSDEHTATRIKSEIISSLGSDEFCNIEFEPWHQDLRTYQAKISKEIDTLTQGDIPIDSQDNASYRYFLDIQRLGLLNDIIRYYESENSDHKKMQEDISEYNKKFGSLPNELLEIIEKRK